MSREKENRHPLYTVSVLALSVCSLRSHPHPPFVAARHLPPARGKSFLKGRGLGKEMKFSAIPSQALPRQLPRRGSQGLRLVAKALGVMRKFPAVLLALPLRKDFPRAGGRCRAATKGGIWQSRQALTERASPLKVFPLPYIYHLFIDNKPYFAVN